MTKTSTSTEKPARKMPEAYREKLTKLIATIETQTYASADYSEQVVASLKKVHKAKITDKGQFWQVSMAGITATATGGKRMALANWANAARRALLWGEG